MIIGEIKRYLRDDGILKVSRSLKENHYRIYQVREALTRRLEREPTTGEMAEEMGISIEELVMTMESGAEVESLHKTIYQGEGTEISLMDKLPEKENRQEKVLDRIFLEEILGTLEAKERRLIYMRYFQNMTQMEIAHELGVSQVQVSRSSIMNSGSTASARAMPMRCRCPPENSWTNRLAWDSLSPTALR